MTKWNLLFLCALIVLGFILLFNSSSAEVDSSSVPIPSQLIGSVGIGELYYFDSLGSSCFLYIDASSSSLSCNPSI